MPRPRFRTLVLGFVLPLVLLASGYGYFTFKRFRPAAMTIGQRVFYFTDNPDRALLRIHEGRHKLQYRETGTLLFLYRYLTSLDFRLRMEAQAVATEVCFLERSGWRHDVAARIRTRVKKLPRYGAGLEVTPATSWAYLWQAYGNGDTCETILADVGITPLSPNEKMALRLARFFSERVLLAEWTHRASDTDSLLVTSDTLLSDSIVQHAWRIATLTPHADLSPDLNRQNTPFTWTHILEQDTTPELLARVSATDSTTAAIVLLSRAPRIDPSLVWDSIPNTSRAIDLPTTNLAGLHARTHEVLQHSALALRRGHAARADTLGRALFTLGARLADQAPDASLARGAWAMEAAGLLILSHAAYLRGNPEQAASLGMLADARRPLDSLLANDTLARPASTDRRDPIRTAQVAIHQVLNPLLPKAVRWDAYYRAHLLATCGGVRIPPYSDPISQASALTHAIASTRADSALAAAYQRWPASDWDCTLLLESIQ